jgi:hypothetical protein
MPEIKSMDTVYMITAFIVPGLIMIFMRGQMTTGRIPSHKESFLTYFALSVTYYAIIFPIINEILFRNNFLLTYISWIMIIFVIPFELGILLGFDARFGWSRTIFGKIGLPEPTHAIPTAWDYKFSNLASEFALITLKNGNRIAGFLSGESFVSTDQAERDIYIEKVYDMNGTKWIDKGDLSLLVMPGEISTIHFWPNNNAGGAGVG